MKFFSIILNEAPPQGDQKFFDLITSERFELWRYFHYSWIIATPDNISAENILDLVAKSYGGNFPAAVLEVDIKHVAAKLPIDKATPKNQQTALNWFKTTKKGSALSRPGGPVNASEIVG